MAINRSYESVDTFGEDFDLDARPAQATSSDSTAIKSGWGAAEELAPQSDFPVDFKHSESIQVIKFLDENGPCASYKQHFLQQKPGKKSYICLGANCPLCVKLGHKPEDKRVFTIVNLSAEPIQRQILVATPRLFRNLHQAEFSPQGPLTKIYWGLSRSGEKQSTVYHLTPIKPRDLEEDWGISAEKADAAIASMKPYTAQEVARETPYAELLEIANDLA
jgi:hypothetical protein